MIDVFNPTGAFIEAWNGADKPSGKSKTPNDTAKSFNGFQEVESIGKLGVAIDQSTGDVYVASSHYRIIDKFSAAGEYLSQITGLPPITTSMTASAGSLYTLSPVALVSRAKARQAVQEFDASGNLVTSFGDTTPTPDGRLAGRETPLGIFGFEPNWQA